MFLRRSTCHIASCPTFWGQHPEWTIHSLNIHGIFFQKLIASIVDKHNEKQLRLVTTEYPVEFPSGNQYSNRKESRLDVYAQIRPRFYPTRRICLLIECKKANPDFVDWIFFPKFPSFGLPKISFLLTTCIQNDNKEFLPKHIYETRPNESFLFSDEAREARSSYKNISNNIKTKTSNAAITEAAYQVTLATHAIADEHYKNIQNAQNRVPESTHLYLPIIVTTANLFLCEFDPDTTEIETGEIEYQQINMKPIDRLIYEYPVPPHLQIKSDDWLAPEEIGKVDRLVRRHILVVNSNHFESTLDWLIRNDEYIVDG